MRKVLENNEATRQMLSELPSVYTVLRTGPFKFIISEFHCAGMENECPLIYQLKDNQWRLQKIEPKKMFETYCCEGYRNSREEAEALAISREKFYRGIALEEEAINWDYD